MIKKKYSIPSKAIKLILQVTRSNFTFLEKIQVFLFISSNYLKGKFTRANKNPVCNKIFNFKIYSFDYATLNFLFKEIFLSKEYNFDSSNRSPKIIDCGANIGMTILFFKKLFPNCSIIAFEPNPYAFELLKRNVTENNLTNIQLFNIGLAKINGEMKFYMGNNKGTLIGSFISERGGENEIRVKTRKLSEIINNEEFDLIKMDIEGSEIQVIKDLISERKINQIKRYLIEYHHRISGIKSNFSYFIKCFEDNNYEYNIRTNFNQTGDFQDVFLDIYMEENILN